MLLNHWMLPGASFLSCEAASLHSKLVHLLCIFPLIFPCLHSIMSFSSFFKSLCMSLQVLPPLVADLSWVHFLVQSLLNQMPLVSPQVIDLQWWGDASTSFGIGIVIVNWWAIWKWSLGFCVGPRLNFNIGWAEAVAIELGLCMAIHLSLFSCTDPSQSGLLQQPGCHCGHEQRLLLQQRDKHHTQTCISTPSSTSCSTESHLCHKPQQHFRYPLKVKRGHAQLPHCTLPLDLAATTQPV